MHLHVFRDESRSGHLDIVGDGNRPWTIDLVAVIVGTMLVLGFAAAIGANLIWGVNT